MFRATLSCAATLSCSNLGCIAEPASHCLIAADRDIILGTAWTAWAAITREISHKGLPFVRMWLYSTHSDAARRPREWRVWAGHLYKRIFGR